MNPQKKPTPFFPEYGSDYQFPQFEHNILQFWKQQRIFERVLSTKASRKQYGFYDGPPFATGLPHYGHLLAGTIKDIVPRYFSMRGFHVDRKFGWDCHGLPVEFEMEKQLNLNGSLDIIDYGIAKFNEACRGIVLRYTEDWRTTVERIGRWVDLDNDYKTMDPSFMESVWWIFSELWKKGLIYQGKKVVPYSWRITAPLSNFEASLNYRSVQDPAITVLFPLLDTPQEAFLAWTTTPWTLPANLALCVHPELSYVKVAIKNPLTSSYAWIGKTRLKEYEKELDQAILEEKKGKELLGINYIPLFPFYESRKMDGAFRVIEGSFVTDSDGTGFVHTAPSFGEDDFYACQSANISPVDPTDMQANFTQEAPPYAGKFVKDADPEIIKDIKNANRLLKHATLQHNYPYCYRSDTPLIYKAISSWFVAVERIKEDILANNQKITWVPSHIKEGRFGKWLENARDWCISRNRFWGTPIPVWICESCGEKKVISSREELNTLAGKPIEDLHSHFVDTIQTDCPKCNGKQKMKRTPEVLDCWFESGSMPYAQLHYPFENKELFEQSFPADFIAEGLDQTRGWFYTLTILSTALRNQPAFKNCIVNGLVLAEDGKKMSKRLKNYPDPSHIFEKYGADALRLYFMQSSAMHGEELRFSERYLVEHMRAVMLPLWNAYGFFSSYANIDGFLPEDKKQAPAIKQRPRIDQWILALLKKTELDVHKKMEQYELAGVSPILANFIDNLTNWYIRLNRSRYWSSRGEQFSDDKLSAYATLWEILDRLSTLMAPFLPFFSESLSMSLHSGIHPMQISSENNSLVSVHEKLFILPESIQAEDEALIAEMDIAQKCILLGRSLRAEAKINLRQPLEKISIAGLSAQDKIHLQGLKELVLQELNLKKLEILKDGTGLVIETAKPNLKRLGPKLGKRIGEVKTALQSWKAYDIQNYERRGYAEIADIKLEKEDVIIERTAVDGKCAGSLNGVVAELDTKITANLKKEGLCREIAHRIQQKRKDMRFNLIDRIAILWTASGLCAEILSSETANPSIISHEVLAKRWKESQLPDSENTETVFFEEHGSDCWMAFQIEKIEE